MSLLDVWAGVVYDDSFYNVALKDVLVNDFHCLDKSSLVFISSKAQWIAKCKIASKEMTDSEEWNGRSCKKNQLLRNIRPDDGEKISWESNAASIYILSILV